MRSRDRGNLFENADKKKPSQPDFQGDCTIDGVAYEIRGWRREDQVTVSVAPPRGDRNTYPPDVFKGALEAVVPPPAPKKSKNAPKDPDAPPVPAWIGQIESDEVAYQLTAFEKQGKSGRYFTLSFEKTDKAPKESEFVDEVSDHGEPA